MTIAVLIIPPASRMAWIYLVRCEVMSSGSSDGLPLFFLQVFRPFRGICELRLFHSQTDVYFKFGKSLLK